MAHPHEVHDAAAIGLGLIQASLRGDHEASVTLLADLDPAVLRHVAHFCAGFAVSALTADCGPQAGGRALRRAALAVARDAPTR